VPLLKKYVILFSAFIFLFGCTNEKDNHGNDHSHDTDLESNNIENTDNTIDNSDTPMSVSNDITVNATEMKFTLDRNVVKKGEVITATITNTGKVFHDWVFLDMPVEIVAQPNTDGDDHHGDSSNGHDDDSSSDQHDNSDGHHDDSSSDQHDNSDGHHDDSSSDQHDNSDGHHDDSDEDHKDNHNGTLHVNVSPGETVTIQFIVLETGTFKFICSVPGHEVAGMVGELTVIE
jgi:uncharacterized cupredoxin-like copper-binding protein